MKKLIVLATLAALPAVAMADVTVSGKIDVAVTNLKADSKASKNDMFRNAGEIVFSGNEDLGNGLKAIWQVANRIDPTGDETANTWNGRDTFIGLAGAFGTVKFGNVSNPTNSGFGSAAEIFSVVDLDGNAAVTGSQLAGEKRLKHSIRYDAPVFNGVTVALSHQLKESATSAAYNNSFGIKYDAGIAKFEYANSTDKNVGVSQNQQQFSVASKFDALGVNFGYASTKKGAAKTHGYGLSATYAMGKVTPKVGYWKEADSKDATGTKLNNDFSVFTVGVNYDLSKRTWTGVEFQRTSDQGSTDNGTRVFAFYLGHKF